MEPSFPLILVSEVSILYMSDEYAEAYEKADIRMHAWIEILELEPTRYKTPLITIFTMNVRETSLYVW
jgi:hypothetical protein